MIRSDLNGSGSVYKGFLSVKGAKTDHASPLAAWPKCKVFDACAKSGQPDAAVQALQHMLSRKLQPDLVAFASIVDGFSQLGQATFPPNVDMGS